MKIEHNTRKHQILQAAMEIIATDGLDNLTMLKIGERVGISDAALYKHFKSKKTILMEMTQGIKQSMYENIQSEVLAMSGSPVDKLRAFLRLHLTFLEQRKGLPRILFSEALHTNDPLLQQALGQIINNYLSFVEGLLIAGKKAGLIRDELDTETAAQAFLGMTQGTVILWALSGSEKPLTNRWESLWDVFSQSLLKT